MTKMTASSATPAPAQRRSVFGRRRVTLMASAGLVAVVLAAGLGFDPNGSLNSFTAPAYAQGTQRPAGFADIVEKVKPAVISVRVRMDEGGQASALRSDDPFGPGSPFEEFFKRFGRPDGMPGQRGGSKH